MNAIIKLKSSPTEMTLNDLQKIKLTRSNGETEYISCENFIFEPDSACTFIGEEIFTMRIEDIEYVRFINRK